VNNWGLGILQPVGMGICVKPQTPIPISKPTLSVTLEKKSYSLSSSESFIYKSFSSSPFKSEQFKGKEYASELKKPM